MHIRIVIYLTVIVLLALLTTSIQSSFLPLPSSLPSHHSHVTVAEGKEREESSLNLLQSTQFTVNKLAQKLPRKSNPLHLPSTFRNLFQIRGGFGGGHYIPIEEEEEVSPPSSFYT